MTKPGMLSQITREGWFRHEVRNRLVEVQNSIPILN